MSYSGNTSDQHNNDPYHNQTFDNPALFCLVLWAQSDLAWGWCAEWGGGGGGDGSSSHITEIEQNTNPAWF